MAAGQPPRATGKARTRTTPMIGRKFDMLGPPPRNHSPSHCRINPDLVQRLAPSDAPLPPRPGDLLVVSAPGAAPMTRRAPRRHQHQVESEVEAGEVGSLEQKGLCGAFDPPPLAWCQGRR